MLRFARVVVTAGLMWLPTSLTLAQPASTQRSPTSTVQALQRIPGVKPRNIVFILTDDHRYDAWAS